MSRWTEIFCGDTFLRVNTKKNLREFLRLVDLTHETDEVDELYLIRITSHVSIRLVPRFQKQTQFLNVWLLLLFQT